MIAKLSLIIHLLTKRSNSTVIPGSGRAEEEEKEAHQEEQQAGVDGSSVVRQCALLVGLQAGSISENMGNVVLLLDPVEKLRHGTFGKDSYILYGMGL